MKTDTVPPKLGKFETRGHYQATVEQVHLDAISGRVEATGYVLLKGNEARYRVLWRSDGRAFTGDNPHPWDLIKKIGEPEVEKQKINWDGELELRTGRDDWTPCELIAEHEGQVCLKTEHSLMVRKKSYAETWNIVRNRKVKKKGWVNIYPGYYQSLNCRCLYLSQKLADEAAMESRIDCIEIEWEE